MLRNQHRLSYLDGLRGLAALFVVLHHIWILQFGAVEGIKGIAVNWLNYGHLSVDVFIVLSGFCLALPLSKSGVLKGSALEFFGRRARRILPTYYAALLLALCLDFLVKHFGHSHPSNGDSPLAMHTIFANAFLLQDFWQRTNTIDAPFWSVALEWKIYFLFPLLLWMCKRWGLSSALAFSTITGYGLTLLLRNIAPGINLEHACPWYLILFTLGISMSLWSARLSSSAWSEKSWSVWASAAISFAVAAVLLCLFPIQQGLHEADFRRWLPLTDVFFGTFVACFLAMLAHAPETNIALKLLSSRPLVLLGTFSYSLYLIHIPFLEFFRGIVSHTLGNKHSALDVWICTVVLGLPIILAASYFFHLAFERPFMSKRGAKNESQAETAAIASPAP